VKASNPTLHPVRNIIGVLIHQAKVHFLIKSALQRKLSDFFSNNKKFNFRHSFENQNLIDSFVEAREMKEGKGLFSKIYYKNYLGLVAHTFTCPRGLFFNSITDGCDFR